jgi:hypothetical protein
MEILIDCLNITMYIEKFNCTRGQELSLQHSKGSCLWRNGLHVVLLKTSQQLLTTSDSIRSVQVRIVMNSTLMPKFHS